MAEGRVTIETDVVFGRGGDRDLRCDIYTPPGGADRSPAVILVHGGAWRQGDRTQLRGYGILLGRERERGAVPLVVLTQATDEAVARMAGPVNHVTPEFPPTLLIHGTADTTVPPLASIRMYEALVAAKVPVELHMYAEQPHAFDAQPAFGRQCAAEMLLFLDRYARPPRSVDAR